MSRSKKNNGSVFTDWTFNQEKFYFMGRGFDIDAAKRILSAKPHAIGTLNPEDLRGLIIPRGVKFAMGVEIDYAKIDAGIEIAGAPVIIAMVKGNSGKSFPLLIDGWHRAAAALEQSVGELSCMVLTARETKQIEI